MNNIKIEIEQEDKTFKDYSKKAYAPYKYGDFLDEQLEEGLLVLKKVKDEYFYPLTRVRLTFTNTPDCLLTAAMAQEIIDRNEDESVTYAYNAETKKLTATKEKDFFVANDNAYESPVGSGLYSHEIYVIEITKIAEGYIGDSLTFTNALGSVYVEETGQ